MNEPNSVQLIPNSEWPKLYFLVTQVTKHSETRLKNVRRSLKRETGTGVFLRILQNFQETCFTEHLKETASEKPEKLVAVTTVF